MPKSRSFSIYLLKDGFNHANAIVEHSGLQQVDSARVRGLPEGAVLYLLDNEPAAPWWKEYWGIENDLKQVLKGAIVFLPVNNRCFALTYGHTYHALKNIAYEYDFGLRTTLNALDPEKVKSTDILSPETAKRERIQSPISAAWTFFDFKQDESIVKKLHGAVKPEYESLFKNVTGSASLKFSSASQPDNLRNLCNKLLEIYALDTYKQTFPDLQGIIPVNDPSVIAKLQDELINGFMDKSKNLTLTIPDIINSEKSIEYYYSGSRLNRRFYDDVYIDHYRDYLVDQIGEYTRSDIDIKLLLKHTLNLKAEDGQKINSFPVLKCMLFDCELDSEHYHLCDGEWYLIDKSYLSKLKSDLDPIFVDKPELSACIEKKEDDYNKKIADKNAWICLDKTNISLPKQTQVEPCDLLYSSDEVVKLIHIKISTRSSSLSHLFNQGLNSIELLRSESVAKNKLKKLVNNDGICADIDNDKFEIIYGIITAKPSDNKSDNLPIFSRISLMRTLRTCRLYGVKCSVVLIDDQVDRKK